MSDKHDHTDIGSGIAWAGFWCAVAYFFTHGGVAVLRDIFK